MGQYNPLLIGFGLFLYFIGFLIGLGVTFLGVIPIFGDIANMAGGLVEEFFQFMGLIIMVFLGRK